MRYCYVATSTSSAEITSATTASSDANDYKLIVERVRRCDEVTGG